MVMLLPLTPPCLACKVNLQASRVEWYLPGMEWAGLGLCGSQSLIQAGRVRFLRCVAWKEVGVNANVLYTSTLFKCGDKTFSLWKNKDEGDGYLSPLILHLYSYYMSHVSPKIYAIIVCRLMIEISNQLKDNQCLFHMSRFWFSIGLSLWSSSFGQQGAAATWDSSFGSGQSFSLIQASSALSQGWERRGVHVLHPSL